MRTTDRTDKERRGGTVRAVCGDCGEDLKFETDGLWTCGCRGREWREKPPRLYTSVPGYRKGDTGDEACGGWYLNPEPPADDD